MAGSGISLKNLPLRKSVRQKLEAGRELNILVLGRYHVGKSTLINTLFYREGEEYQERAQEGFLESCTRDVETHRLTLEGCTLNIYDSPGLQDDTKVGDYQRLKLIATKCPDIHLIIYCKKMGEPIRPAEKEALNNISRAFRSTIWNDAIIALTFANTVDPPHSSIDKAQHFKKTKDKNVEEFEKVFKEIGVRSELLIKRIYPAGSAKVLRLPGMSEDDNWVTDFLVGCLEACKEDAKGVMLEVCCKDPNFLAKVRKASETSRGAGIAGIAGGAGCVIAGTVLTATGILAPVGIALIVGGAVGGSIGAVATAGGTKALKYVKEEEGKVNNKTK